MKVLDDSVVCAVDMDGNLGDRPGIAAFEPGQGNGAQTVVTRPPQRVKDIGRGATATRWRREHRPVGTGL